jgi:hypothetical protein
MKSLTRTAGWLLLTALIVAWLWLWMAAPALATEGPEETATTVAEEPAPTVDFEPAVPVTAPETSEPLPDWTYRYMVPTAIALAVIVVVITCIQYFTRVVRRRYRIVEE